LSHSEHADVLIIGAGAAGGIAGSHLIESGMSVTCLEQGDWPDRSAFPTGHEGVELAAMKQWSQDPNVRRAAVDYPIEATHSDLALWNYNAVGGSTVIFGGMWGRMRPADFATGSTEGVGDDWPIAYDELRPFYERVDRQIGVSGLAGNPAFPDVEPALPALPIGQSGLRVARAHARLGWHWWPDTNAILSVDHGGRRACVQLGTCMQGCPVGAKASTDLTHWPGFVAAGGRLLTGARVRRLLFDERGLAAGAEWLDRDGREHVQTADVVVLAAGGVGTPRLLLNSAHGRAPDGAANSSGLVGRRLMLHPLVMTQGVFEDPMNSWQGQYGSLIQSYEFYDSDDSRGFARGAKWSLHTTGGPLAAALPGPGMGSWGEAHHPTVKAQLGRGAIWAAFCEDLPEERNRVELSPDTFDSSGIPAPAIHYRVSDNAKAMMEWFGLRQQESLKEAGAHTAMSMHVPVAAHLLGTARMGDDPKSSVVDRWGVTHDIPNLVVADASVFVTSGGVNPASTVCALALRAADHLVEARTRLPVPSRRVQVAPWPTHAAAGRAAVEGAPAPADDGVAILDGAARRRLAVLADALIPAGEEMPSASAAGIADRLLDQVLAVRPDLSAALACVLLAEFADASPYLEQLARRDPEGRSAIDAVVAGGYYLSTDVKARLSYPGPRAVPITPDPHPDYINEGLLGHALAADAREPRRVKR
jgi:choline dehydrogenase-like flavoprotein